VARQGGHRQTVVRHNGYPRSLSFCRYHGLWDVNELYDLQADPEETRNLINRPEHQDLVRQLNTRLFEVLKETGGDSMPLKPDRGPTFPMRRRDGAVQATFPESYHAD